VRARAWLVVAVIAAAGGAAVVGLLGERPLVPGFSEAALEGDLEARLAAAEGRLPRLRPGAEKRIVWADPAARARTPLAVVYLHGFSASRAELAPVAEEVAAGLGANLFLTRLTGHGQDGPAMLEGSAAAWMDDAAEAMAIGRRLGERVLLIGTSTGATLAVLAAAEPEVSASLAGVVLVSPNFGMLGRGAWLLDLPLARWWLPLVAGRERGFEPVNARHRAGWTWRYPTAAVLPVAELVRRANRVRFEAIGVPALFLWNPGDRVVDARRTPEVAARWGGPVTLHPVSVGAGDDPAGHVVAGDALSPERTAEVVAAIVDWARGL
jgi:esterase/lipase